MTPLYNFSPLISTMYKPFDKLVWLNVTLSLLILLIKYKKYGIITITRVSSHNNTYITLIIKLLQILLVVFRNKNQLEGI